MQDVLHQLIDRVRYHTEQEIRDAHAAIDAWFDQHFPPQPAPSNVDSPAPGSASASAAVTEGDHSE